MYEGSKVSDLQVINIDDEVMEFNGKGWWDGAVNVFYVANAVVVTEGVGYTNVAAATNGVVAAEAVAVAGVVVS